MNIIESVQIKGFWGNHDVSINFNDSYNFIIGPNGSGKSTALKLIAGILLADKHYLSSLEFDTIKLVLREPGSRKRPYIEVSKNKEAPFFHCNYKIYESASEKPYSYELSEIDGYESANRHSYFLRMQLAGKTAAGKNLVSHLKEMINLTWLSVQRHDNFEWGKSEDPINARLEDFSNRLVRYLAAINKKVNALHESFQEQVFLSLLVREDTKGLSVPEEKKLESERAALNQIFSEFKVDKRNYAKKIESHFDILKKLRAKMDKQSGLTESDVMALFSLSRIENTVDAWEAVSAEKKKILAPRDRFMLLLNELMNKKSLNLNERGEIAITTQSGKKLTPSQLSSGEKQIIIILGEALLQEGNRYVYMADEPEISLHVAWQETIARDIKSLNPAAQIIFATHSPDIVGQEQRSLIDMEKHIK